MCTYSRFLHTMYLVLNPSLLKLYHVIPLVLVRSRCCKAGSRGRLDTRRQLLRLHMRKAGNDFRPGVERGVSHRCRSEHELHGCIGRNVGELPEFASVHQGVLTYPSSRLAHYIKCKVTLMHFSLQKNGARINITFYSNLPISICRINHLHQPQSLHQVISQTRSAKAWLFWKARISCFAARV